MDADERARRALREMCELQYSELERMARGEEERHNGHEK